MKRVVASAICLLVIGAIPARADPTDDLAAQRERNLRAAAQLMAKGDESLARHDAETAIDMYQRALVADPASAVALRKLGIAYKDAKAYTDAMKYCGMSLALEPGNVESLACQGVGAANREEFDLAVYNLRQIKVLCKKSCPEYKELRSALKENFPARFRRVHD